MIRIWCLMILGALVAVSCAPKEFTADPAKQSDKQIYDRAVAEMKNKNYETARELYRTVFENFPKSDYRISAKLGVADSFFYQGSDPNYLLAIQEYQDFISLFPFSPKAEYAQLQIGRCYYEMREKPDRDQSNTRKALEELRKVLDNYPNGSLKNEAYDYLLKTYAILAEHEFLIARFYVRTDRPQAAAERLKGILKDYPEAVFQPKFYFYLAQSLEKMQQLSESCAYYDTLLAKWPNSEFTQDAQESRGKTCKGVEQAENKE